MAELFNVDRSRITRHINNIYKEKELNQKSTCAENAHMGSTGKQKYKYKLYNLYMIISTAYSINSKQGTGFRKWVSTIIIVKSNPKEIYIMIILIIYLLNI